MWGWSKVITRAQSLGILRDVRSSVTWLFRPVKEEFLMVFYAVVLQTSYALPSVPQQHTSGSGRHVLPLLAP